jgi:hypothetical protein
LSFIDGSESVEPDVIVPVPGAGGGASVVVSTGSLYGGGEAYGDGLGGGAVTGSDGNALVGGSRYSVIDPPEDAVGGRVADSRAPADYEAWRGFGASWGTAGTTGVGVSGQQVSPELDPLAYT